MYNIAIAIRSVTRYNQVLPLDAREEELEKLAEAETV